MASFVAHVELEFEADSLKAGGQRLHELTQVARSAGFDLKRGRVEPAPAQKPSAGWSRYTLDEE